MKFWTAFSTTLTALYTLFTLSHQEVTEIRLDTLRLHRKTSEHFVGVSIDSHQFQKYWRRFSDSIQSVKLQTLASALAPSFVRVGGTSSDFLIFDDGSPNFDSRRNKQHPSRVSTAFTAGRKVDGHLVSRERRMTTEQRLFDWDVYYSDDVKKDLNNFTMTGPMFDAVYKFVELVGWNMTFDLNVLLRNGESWDPANAVKLIDHVVKRGYRLAGWELGNEPNAFYHLVKFRLQPEQLARDYMRLKQILAGYRQFDNCVILGPSVTQLDKKWTNEFFERFLSSGGKNVVTAATFHQYYLSSKSTSIEDYTDPTVLNTLAPEVARGVNMTRAAGARAQLWLGETSSAVGSLHNKASFTYRAGFMWLDKLGVSAYGGVDVVIRQSFFGKMNSLIDSDTLDPRPDYWLTLLYKLLVGNKVLRVISPGSKGKLRAYAHCVATGRSGYGSGSVVVYVMNLYNTDMNLTFPPFSDQDPIHLYSMEPKHGRLDSRTVLLNGKRLQMVNNTTLPSLLRPITTRAPVTVKALTYSFIVWLTTRVPACSQES